MQRGKLLFLVLASSGAFITSACSHTRSTEAKLDKEVASQTPVAMGGPVAAESRKLISESTELSEEQKTKLIALHSRMAGEIASMRSEEGKLKMTFFRKLFDAKAGDAELESLKRRMLKLESAKTSKMISAFEEAREILGRNPPRDERLFRAFGLDHPHYGEFM